MAQYQVYRTVGGRLLLDLQSDLIETGTRVVAALLPLAHGPRPIGRLEPIFEIDGVPHVLHTAELAAIPAAVLKGRPVADLSGHDYAIKGAIDMVFSGF
jgi:toxin CcdB